MLTRGIDWRDLVLGLVLGAMIVAVAGEAIAAITTGEGQLEDITKVGCFIHEPPPDEDDPEGKARIRVGSIEPGEVQEYSFFTENTCELSQQVSLVIDNPNCKDSECDIPHHLSPSSQVPIAPGEKLKWELEIEGASDLTPGKGKDITWEWVRH